MKEFIIAFVAFIVVAAFIGHLEISFSPFKVSLPMWHRVIAVVLFVAGFVFLSLGERRNAYSEGLKRGMEITLNKIKKEIANE